MLIFTNRSTCVLVFAVVMVAIATSAVWLSSHADRDVQFAKKEIVIEPLDFVMPFENGKRIDDSTLASALTNDEKVLVRLDCDLNLDLTCRAYRISRSRWTKLRKWKPEDDERCPISIEAAVKEGYHGFVCVVTNNPTNVKLISVELTRPRLPLSLDEYIWMYSLTFAYEADDVSRLRRMFVLLDGQCVYPDEADYSLNMAELMAYTDDGWLNRFKRAFRCLVPMKLGHGENSLNRNVWASNYGDILDGRLDRFCKE